MVNKNKTSKEKYYICPNCGDLATGTNLLEACKGGGMPYCYCEFNEERTFVGYKRIAKKLWEELNKYKSNKAKLKKYRQSIKSRIMDSKNKTLK